MWKQIIKSNSLWAIFVLVLRSATNFFLAPYLTNKVGIDAYGYISLANNLILYIDVICVAFNYFAGRNISISYHQQDFSKANNFYSTILAADFFLCIILGTLGMGFVIYADKFINISSQLCTDVKLLFFFILIKYFISLFGSTLEVGTFIQNRLDISNKNRIISLFVYVICISICFCILSPRVWYIGLSALIQSIVFLILQIQSKIKAAPLLRFHANMFSLLTVKYYIANGVWISFNNLGNILNDGLDLLITNLMISETMVGMISIAKLLGNFCYSIVTSVSNSLRPRQLEEYSKNNIEGLIQLLHRSMRINGAIYCVYMGCIIGCGRDFLGLWMKGQDISVLYNLTFFATICFMIPAVVCPLYYVFVLVQKVKFTSYITISMGVVNVISMFLLLKLTSFGGYSVLITTAVLNLVHLFDTPIYASHCLKVSWRAFYSPIVVHLLNCGVIIFVCRLFFALTPYSIDYMFLGLKGLVCIILCMIVIFISIRLFDARHYKIIHTKQDL